MAGGFAARRPRRAREPDAPASPGLSPPSSPPPPRDLGRRGFQAGRENPSVSGPKRPHPLGWNAQKEAKRQQRREAEAAAKAARPRVVSPLKRKARADLQPGVGTTHDG